MKLIELNRWQRLVDTAVVVVAMVVPTLLLEFFPEFHSGLPLEKKPIR